MVFVGEFGVCRKEKHLKGEDLRKEVEISLWVYDFKKQENSCNVTFENDRRYQLEKIVIYNKKLINQQRSGKIKREEVQ
ncbi:MAG: hypothetical protein N2Z64_01830 [Dictyoglomus thermophilum]|nr:hypothetical protein [Dictyoglomus thermophilum]MCX7719996.1 hypothetical protein [Dictyoglomus thermophilum]